MEIKLKITRQRVALVVAALVLGGVTGSASANHAIAVVPADPTDFVASGGYLALELRSTPSGGATGAVVQYSAPGVEVDRETLSVDKWCEVTTNGRLLKFVTSLGTTVGLHNNGLGTKNKKTCSPAEGRTAPGETFIVSLGSKFDSSSVAIDSAELDIEGKFSANLRWIARNGLASVYTGDQFLASSTDSGPDAGTGDNNQVKIGAKGDDKSFNSLTLFTDAGEFALDGGGDGPYSPVNSVGTNDSVFFLTGSAYGYTVDCGETVVATNGELAASNHATQNDSRVSELHFLRLANKNQTTCAEIGVNVSASDTPEQPDGAYFDNSSTSASGALQNVRARVMIVWTVEMAGKDQIEIDAELSREVMFAVDGQSVPVSNCLNVPAVIAAHPMDPSNTGLITHPAATPWCLMSDSRVVSGTTIIQTQYYSGNGDPRVW